ncbi:MAG: D-2-hydroxyacid dehydrogenase [Bacteroidales bacterium]|nr:D-2-hydroxyacid dehydrogenase [Bacteroidales bacterium]
MKSINRIVCLDGATLYPADDSRWAPFAAIADFEVYARTAPTELIERIGDAEAILSNKVVIDADTIAALPRLRYIGVLATGYNVVDTAAARAAGIVVTNIPSYSTASVAQTVFALLLAITNRVEHYAAENAAGRWANSPDFSYRDLEWSELAGKTFGIVGLGSIGRAVAAIASAMGMRVAVYTSKAASELPEGFVKMELDELFAAADVLSFHCPLTPETRNLVDARRLALMKPSAIIINTSRGPVVDEQALADALNSGRIYAAGLDVLAQEPPKADCPLLGARNCFITPHLAWASAEARSRLMEIAVANVRAFTEGCPQNVVN